MLFVATNAKRVWCSSAACGNRERVARHARLAQAWREVAMSKHYAGIAFTDAVQDVQERYGSRAFYGKKAAEAATAQPRRIRWAPASGPTWPRRTASSWPR